MWRMYPKPSRQDNEQTIHQQYTSKMKETAPANVVLILRPVVKKATIVP